MHWLARITSRFSFPMLPDREGRTMHYKTLPSAHMPTDTDHTHFIVQTGIIA